MAGKTLPRPVRFSPLGMIRSYNNPKLHHCKLRERYGDLVPVRVQGRDHAIVLSPEGARDVFSADPYGYDVFWKESFAALMGAESVWVLTKEAHRRERMRSAPAGHAYHFRPHGDTIRDIARAHTASWQAGRTVSGFETTLAISLDVILQLVFGMREGALMDEGRVVVEAHRRSTHPLAVFFPKLQRPWFPLWRRYQKATVRAYDWFARLLAWHRTQGGSEDTVLARLLAARDDEGRPLPDDYIHSQLISILSAGQETTAVALAWQLYELGRRPAVLARLRAELSEAGADADPMVVAKLPYLAAVCNETIRIHPVLAECARIPTTPIEVLGYTIPPGQPLVMSIIGIHHHPSTYPDADEFRPERFLERSFSNVEFMPYGGGHRRCLGAGLAEYTSRLALAEIVSHWDFEPARADRDTRLNVAMGPRRGVPLRITAQRKPLPRRAQAELTHA
jgi:cytochrome P450 family 110